MRDIFKNADLISANMEPDENEDRQLVTCTFGASSVQQASRLLIYLLSLANDTDSVTEEVLGDHSGGNKDERVVLQHVVVGERTATATAEPATPSSPAPTEAPKRTRTKKETAATPPEAPPVNTPTPATPPDFSQAVAAVGQVAESAPPTATLSQAAPADVQATTVTVAEQPAHQREIDELRSMTKQLQATGLPFDFALGSIQQHAAKAWPALSATVVERWVRTLFGAPAEPEVPTSVIDTFGGASPQAPTAPLQTPSTTMAASVQAAAASAATPSAGLVQALHDLLVKLSADGSVTVPTFGAATRDLSQTGVTAEQIVEALRSRPDLFAPFSAVAGDGALGMLAGILPIFWR